MPEDRERIADAITRARRILSENPDKAIAYRDDAATAVVESGLRVQVSGANGASVVTDMTRGVGGEASAPSPGWLFRASVASCVATLIAMRAAEKGVDLPGLEVTVDSESDDRGILAVGDDVPAGPLSMRVAVRVGASAASEAEVRDIVTWGKEHCPVCDAVGRAVPVELLVEVG